MCDVPRQETNENQKLLRFSSLHRSLLHVAFSLCSIFSVSGPSMPDTNRTSGKKSRKRRRVFTQRTVSHASPCEYENTPLPKDLPPQIRAKAKHHLAKSTRMGFFARVHSEMRLKIRPSANYSSTSSNRANERRAARSGLGIACRRLL